MLSTRTTHIPWGTRPYEPGDEVQAARLVARVFERAMTPAHYRWKVLEAPDSAAVPAVWFADTGQQIIGQYGGIPLRFQMGAQRLHVMHCSDVLTHPDFRRQGVLTAVGHAATEGWRRGGIAFLTGLPHEDMGSRLNYLGWQPQLEVGWFRRPLRFSPIFQRRNVHGGVAVPLIVMGLFANLLLAGVMRMIGRKVRVEATQPDAGFFDTLWERLHGQYHALVVRDGAWMRYRYIAPPDVRYQLLAAWRGTEPAGYLVYRVTQEGERRIGWVVDLFADPRDQIVRVALLRAAMERLWFQRAESIRVLLATRSPLLRHFRLLGFTRGHQTHTVSVVPLADDSPPPALRDPACWYLMAGDLDLL